MDNATLVIEVFHSMKVGWPILKDDYMAVKLNMMTAYDRGK